MADEAGEENASPAAASNDDAPAAAAPQPPKKKTPSARQSLDGKIKYGAIHYRRALTIQCAGRQYVAFLKAYAKANELIEKILEPTLTKEYGRPMFYYYNSVLCTTRWSKPKFLGSLDIEKLAPTYALEEAAIMVQGVWRKRQSWKKVLAKLATVWSTVQDETTGQSYYYNYLTGACQWEKPALLGSEELDDYQGKWQEIEEQEAEAAKAAEKNRKREEKKAARLAANERKKNKANKSKTGDDDEADDDEGDDDEEEAEEEEAEEEAEIVMITSSDDDDDSSGGGGGSSDDDGSVGSDFLEPRDWPRSKAQRLVDGVEDERFRWRFPAKFSRVRWAMLRAAVFLGGFERARRIKKLPGGLPPVPNTPPPRGDSEDNDDEEEEEEEEEEEDDDDDDDERKKKKKMKKQKGEGERTLPAGRPFEMCGMGLTQVSSRLWEAGEVVTSLDLSRNALPHVSEDLANLSRLEALDLSYNALRRVPGSDWFATDESLWEGMTRLRRIDLSHSTFVRSFVRLFVCSFVRLFVCSLRP
jgi:hypothetical protein